MHPMLSDAEYKAKMAEMETDRKAGIIIMKGVIRTLEEKKVIKKKPIIHVGWDLHIFFYPPEDSKHLIHFQLHTLRENITLVNVTIRKIKSEDLPEVRKRTSIGNEETAVTKHILNRAPVPFSQVAIVGVLEQVFAPQPRLPSKETLLVKFGQEFAQFVETQSARSQFDGLLTRLLEQRAVTEPSASYYARLVNARAVGRPGIAPQELPKQS
jgi:hypothetical protein